MNVIFPILITWEDALRGITRMPKLILTPAGPSKISYLCGNSLVEHDTMLAEVGMT